jgi:ankyrin repeat protein
MTALTFAALNGDLSVFRLLIEHGANTVLRDKQGKTALDYVAKNQKSQFVGVIERTERKRVRAATEFEGEKR